MTIATPLPRTILAAACAALFWCAPAAWALSVTASPAPGTYKESVRVTLTPDVAGAKVSYGFNPDGTPGDFYAYAGPVVLTGSTPLVWYAFLDEKTESPISIEKYAFDYAQTFALAGGRGADGKVTGLGVRNGWSADLSAAGWYVRSGTASLALPDRRFAPGEAASLGDLSWAGGALELVAPDGTVQESWDAAKLLGGVAFAAPSDKAASLLDAGASGMAWAALAVALLALVGLGRAAWKVRRAHGGWRGALRAARRALGGGLQKGGK